jgi:hypothetical protein
MNTPLFPLVAVLVLSMSCDQPNNTDEVAMFDLTLQMAGQQEANQLLLQDDGVVIVGTSQSGGQSSLMLMKTDLNGGIMWTRLIATDLMAEGHGIGRTVNGDLILIGSHKVAQGIKNMLVVRTDVGGSVLWQRSLGGGLNDIGRGVIVLNDGNIMVVGTSSSFGIGAADMFVAKLDASGNVLWSETYGGIGLEGGSALAQKDEFEVVVLGFTESFGAGGRDQWLVGISHDGDSIWSRTIGGVGYEESQGLARLQNGGLALCGHSASIDPFHAMHAVRLDGAANLIWEHHLGSQFAHDGGEGVAEDVNGIIWFGGRGDVDGSGEEMYIVRTDADGNLLSEERFGGQGDQWVTDLQSNARSMFILGNSVVAGTANVMLVKRPLSPQ